MIKRKQDEKIISISDFFKEYVFGFIYHDINLAIDGKANFLAALGLLCYTEFVGGLIKPLNNKNKLSGSREKFNSFLPYLGDKYVELNQKHNLYNVFRCGLAHEYFIKQRASIAMYKTKSNECGISCINNHWCFIVEKYFDDFRTGIKDYYNELVVKRNEQLLNNFSKAKSLKKWT